LFKPSVRIFSLVAAQVIFEKKKKAFGGAFDLQMAFAGN